ncbi:hypothetical protein, partial [Candidatus Ichthyocystis sparus]|uniref:hypothetical protein n=1 Tax=Candidatus Ichthyocystis sparus TaxID=1561004 RepID=UPI001F5E545D
MHRCLRKYHANLRPAFIRLLPGIRVLSDSGSDLETLAGGMLMSFLSKLDSAIRGITDGIFNSRWDEAVGKVFGDLEKGALDGVSCKDFIYVLHIAGAPSVASSSLSHLRKQSSRIRKSSKGVNRCAASGEGPSGVPITEERPTSSSSVSTPTSAHAETGIICTTVGEAEHVQCVDLLGVKLHPGSAGMVYKLFSDFHESAKKSYSNSILNYLLMIVDGELPLLGRAIWCLTYRELHLYSFMSKCLSIYYYKCRPDFINSLPSIRVLSNSYSSDCELVPLSGGSLSGFLSKLDCAIRDEVNSTFDLWWSGEVVRVFSKLEDGSLSNVCCEDFFNVLNVAGIPVVALSYYRVRTVGKRKMPENSDEFMGEGTTSEDGTTGTVSSSSSSQLKFELSPQPESELLPQPGPGLSSEPELLSEAVGSSFSPIESIAASVVPNESSSNIGDVVLVSTAEAIVPDLVVLGSELSVPSPIQLEPGLSPQPEPESLYGAIGSPLSVPSPVSLSEPAPLFLPSSESRSVSDISSASLSTEEVVFRSTTIVAPPAFWGLEGESLSPPSSLSILPTSSSSPSLFSSTSESGCDADVSSYSPESPELTREVAGPATESAVSALGVSLGESHSVTSCEQPMVA